MKKPTLIILGSLILLFTSYNYFTKPKQYIDLENATITSNLLYDNDEKYSIIPSQDNVWLDNKHRRKGEHSIGYKLYPGESRRETIIADIPNNTTKLVEFSVYFSSNYIIPTDWNLFAQWWQGAPASPAISFEIPYNENEFRMEIVTRDGTVKHTTARSHYKESIKRNQWVDFVVQFRVDDTGGNNGLLKVWKDGKPIVNYTGKLGYTDLNDKTNFRVGIYRSPQIQSTVETYFDEIKLR